MKFNKMILIGAILIMMSSMSYAAVTTSGNMTYSGGYTIVQFYSNGTFNSTAQLTNVTLMVLGGGGGGASVGGGGGAGEIAYYVNLTLNATSYNAIVGNGGAGGLTNGLKGMNGGNSTFATMIGTGGSGGSGITAGECGTNGTGSGGGGGAGCPGPIIGKIFNGGLGNAGYGTGGGGGGANESGVAAASTTVGGRGGWGTNYSITGSVVCYAGGGSGGNAAGYGNIAGVCGSGQGGSSGALTDAGNATANTGSGGGGSGANGGYTVGGRGATGIIILKYLNASTESANVTITSPANVSYQTAYNFTSVGVVNNLGAASALNITLVANNVIVGSKNGVNATGAFNITSSTLTAGIYAWYFNSTDASNAANWAATDKYYLNIAGAFNGTSSAATITKCKFTVGCMALGCITSCG